MCLAKSVNLLLLKRIYKYPEIINVVDTMEREFKACYARYLGFRRFPIFISEHTVECSVLPPHQLLKTVILLLIDRSVA